MGELDLEVPDQETQHYKFTKEFIALEVRAMEQEEDRTPPKEIKALEDTKVTPSPLSL